MSLVQLVFQSEKTSHFDAAVFQRESVSFAKCNSRRGITGMLVSQEATFSGILEGQEDDLLPLMELIVADRRHRHLAVLLEQYVAQRRFATWYYGPIEIPEPGNKDLTFSELLRNKLSVPAVSDRPMQSWKSNGAHSLVSKI